MDTTLYLCSTVNNTLSVCLCRRMKFDKKGNRPTLKPENGVDSVSVKSSCDGEAQSVRSTSSPHSHRFLSLSLQYIQIAPFFLSEDKDEFETETPVAQGL